MNTTHQRQEPDALPVAGDSAALVAAGIRIDGPVDGDPQFQHVTLPDGWTWQPPQEHPYWSYLVDRHGRRRVAIFVKNTSHDRDALYHVRTLRDYLCDVIDRGSELVFDDTWCTRDGFAREALAYAAGCDCRADAAAQGRWLSVAGEERALADRARRLAAEAVPA